MKEQLIKAKSKTKMMAYLLLVLAIISGIVLGARVLPSISFGAENTQKLIVEAELEKYINYSISDQDKGTLVQYNVKEKVELGENYIPVKNSEVVLQLSQIDGKYPYAVTTITKSTEITNGKTTGMEENCQYDANTGTVILRANNQNERGELIYQDQPSQNAVDEYIILCYYDTYTQENLARDLAINITAKSTLSIDDGAIIDTNATFKTQVTENIGTLTSINYYTEDIYNGYIKSNQLNGTGYHTQYKETEQILVSKKEAQEKLEVLENNTFVNVSQNQVGEEITTDLGNNHNLVYKSTKITKENLVKTLGEDGILEILDANQNVIATINKDTAFDEDGTITINYENEPEAIILKTSKIQNEGILLVEHTKEIKNTITDITNTKIKTITQITGISEEVTKTEDGTEKTVETQKYVYNHENMIGFQEAKTNVSIRVNDTEWTNKQQNEVTFDISLNANTIKDNMFKNPSLRIELPSQVEKVILQNSGVFYANGLELQEPYLETNENGNIVIVANLVGAQTAYHENALELTTDVRITATIILKKDIETTQANANLVYTNQYTLDGSVETGSQALALQLESYQEEQVATMVEESVATYNLGNTTQSNVDALKLEVAPVKGDTNIANSDTVYEGEYIKYNVKVTNTSDETMNDVTIVGSVPEGTTYGELVADYYHYNGDYYYNFDTNVQSKEIEIGTLEAGESITKFYEVKVNDLVEGQDEKQIITNIKAYVGQVEAATYELTNTVKTANANLFISAKLDNGQNRWNYFVQLTGEQDKEVTVTIKFPKEFQFKWLNYNKVLQTMPIDNISMSEDNVVTATLKIDNENPYIFEGVMDSSEIDKNIEPSSRMLVTTATMTLDNQVYTANENRVLYEYNNASISMTSPNEGEEVEYGEEIEYDIIVKNTGGANSSSEDTKAISVQVTDFLPENLQPVSITYETWEQEKTVIDEENGIYTSEGEFKKQEITEDISNSREDEDGNKLPDVEITCTIPYQESITIKVKTIAGLVYEKTKVENSATLTSNETKVEGEETTTSSIIGVKTSNTMTHTILPYDYEEPSVDPDDPNNPDNPDNPDEPGNPDNPIDSNEKYSISGVAWLDENEDGQRQTGEKVLSGITAMVVDTKDATIVKDKVQTSSDGTYRFSDLDKGDYVVLFQYDTNTYRVTEYQKNGVASSSNSDAITKEVTLNGETMKVGIIEVSNLEASVSNMDIGLVENKICDFKLDKSITKVTVTTNSGTKQYSYNDEKLAKIEIRAKEIQGATVIIEYKIVVTNEGELPATVGKVIDYLPEGLTFSSELNKNWSAGSNGQLINTSVANQKIEAGESVELNLVATKTMTTNSTGTFTNAAEIGDITNSLGIADTDSIPGNKVQTEDDYSEAAVILSISTGLIVYVSIGILLAVLVGIAVFVGVKKGKIKFGKITKISMFVIMVISLVFLPYTDSLAIEGKYAPKYAYFEYTSGTVDGEEFECIEPTVGIPIGTKAYCMDVTVNLPNQDKTGPYTQYELSKEIFKEKSSTTITSSISSIKLSGNTDDNIDMKRIDSNNYLFGPFEIECNNNNGYSFVIKDKDGNEITDYSICNENGEAKTIKGNSTFYLKIPGSALSKGISSVQVSNRATITKETTKTVHVYAEYTPAQISGTQRVKCEWDKIDTIQLPEIVTATVTWDSINGALEIIKQDADNSNVKLEGVEITVACPDTGYSTTVTTDSNGRAYLENLPTKRKVNDKWEQLTYSIAEVKTPNYGYKPEASAKIKIGSGQVLTYHLENIKHTGNLLIEKKDKETGNPLEGMSFKIKDAEGKYIIAIDHNQEAQAKVTGTIHLGNLEYTTDENQGTEFITDSNGKIAIYNLLEGTYSVIETSVGDKYNGYEVDDDYITWEANGQQGEGRTATITVNRQKSTDTEPNSTSTNGVTVTINNQRKYIKLSGYVWVDMIDGKTSERTDLYKDPDSKSKTTGEDLPDTQDLLFNGITVRLKDKTTGQIVKDEDGNNMETVTSKLDLYTGDSGNNGNGEYLFDKVLIKDLENYYIEFEYDGLTYTNVTPYINEYNGSKAAESDRTTFNEKFSVVEGETSNTGYTRDANGNEAHTLEYKKDGKVATLISDGDYEIITDNDGNNLYIQQNSIGKYIITSNTDVAKYSIKDNYVEGQDEIRYINLGLYEREQPDIYLEKDLYNVKVSVNGYEHIYQYASRFKNAGVYEEGFNVGVEFGTTLPSGKTSYSRAIYKADYEYENENDKSKELKVYITYQLLMGNTSNNLTAQINSIVDYYDSRYTIVNIGTGLSDENGTATNGDIAHLDENGKLVGNISNETYNDNYNKVVIQNNTTIEAQKAESIYVQFELSKDNVKDILHDKGVGEVADELLENVAEINSYSIYDGDKKIYAGIDKDSNPENSVPGTTDEYEDDTAECPALQLEVADARELTGTVFVDSTSNELMTGQIRQGDGIYDAEAENGVKDVTVTLHELNNSIDDMVVKTDDNGNFYISGYIPGDYIITYTWGDTTYTVQDYKGTVYDESRYNSNQANKFWYKAENSRYTDAIDNYMTPQEAPKGSRLQIDAEMSNSTERTRTQMDSTTPTMGISVEYETTTTASEGQRYTYKISNIDFGIVERARQVLEVSKDVTGVKITLANGQVIVDAQIVNGELQGSSIQGVTYGPADNITKGFIRTEMDNELIQGATIQIEYNVTVENKSEKDYDSESYYKYGIETGHVITIKPAGVYDYLDSEMVLDETQDNGNWEIISKEDYQTTYPSATIIESYFEEGKSAQVGEDGTVTDVYTWSTSQTGYQRIFTQWETELTEEKTVSDIKLENKTILKNADLENEIEPGKNNSVKLYTSKVLANTDEIDLNNDLEVTEIKRVQQTGRIVDVSSSYLYDQSERVTVTPPTGNDQNYLPYIVLGITSCILLVAGIVLIKRKAI